jgi:hypothetical protein
LILAASPVWAANGNIGLFFDEGAALCQYTIPCNGQARIYVYALLQGATQYGITGVEYRVTASGSTAAYLISETFNPTATSVGSGAFPPQLGINLAWATCQVGDGTKILLETVDILNLGCATAELELGVVKHGSAATFYQCPLFTTCDQLFTKYCVGYNTPGTPAPNCFYQAGPNTQEPAQCTRSGRAYVNPGSTRNCTVAVAPVSWSAVKGLYNN